MFLERASAKQEMSESRVGRSHTTYPKKTLFIKWHCLHKTCHGKTAAHPCQGSDSSAQPSCNTVFSRLPRILNMDSADSRPQKRLDDALSTLNVVIETMNLAKEISSVTPAKAVFGSVGVLLTMIRVRFPPSPMSHSRFTRDQDSMANKTDYVELGLACADVCRALDRGMKGRKLDDLSQSVREAIEQLTTWVRPDTLTLDSSLTMLLITGLWQRSKGRSSNKASGTLSLELSMQQTIRVRSRLGSWISIGSFMFSTCVPSPLCDHY